MMMLTMLDKIISGGQTGADQAGLRAARAAGIPTGGFAPLGWLIESPKSRTALAAPWLADFGLVECQEPGYKQRTIANVQAADATLWFGRVDSPIAKLTLETLGSHGKTNLVIIQGHRPSAVVEFFRQNPWIKVVNITGNSESRVPGIGARTERFLAEVFRLLRASEGRSHVPPTLGGSGEPW